MNLKELAKAKRILRDVAQRTEVFTFERVTRGRKLRSHGLTVFYLDGAQRAYYSFDRVERDNKRSFMVFCDNVDNLGFAGKYFPTKQQAERAIGDAEQLLGRELDCVVQFRAEYPNTDYATWSARGW